MAIMESTSKAALPMTETHIGSSIWPMSVKLMVLISIAAAGAMVGGCSSEKEDLEACYRKGITYYREIGSYPNLSDGRDANTVIGERCARSKLAFG